MNNHDQAAVVELRMPCRPEFVGVARLMILGVAGRSSFSYDEIEDIRLAVGEACTAAVERAVKAEQTDTVLCITCRINDSQLTIDVTDEVEREPATAPEDDQPVDGLDEESISALLMELLVDEIRVEPTGPRGTRIHMSKHVGQA
ncbi:MAG: ATP-binding protein [Armatimonadetes bacterium]|nr:ATP-binding protein [Armatimonadota bacterium]